MNAPPASGRFVLMLTADRAIDRRILLEADALIKRGWRVVVLAMPREDDSGADPPWVQRVTTGADGAARERVILAVYGRLRRVVSMNGPVMRNLKAMVWGALANPEAFYGRLFARGVQNLKPDIVVAHDLPMLSVAAEVARRTGARLVYDSHEYWCEKDFPGSWKRAWSRVENRHIHACDLVITINPSIASALAQRYSLPSVEVISNAVDGVGVPGGRLREACGCSADARILLYQGGLTSGRSLELCVDAVAHTRDQRIHLALLGGGTLAHALRERARRRGVARRVTILPPVAQDALLHWSADADAGLIPYGAKCENSRLCTPNKLYEFIAAGLPMLASDLPELRRVIDGQGFGMVARLVDVTSTARAMDEMFRDATRIAQWRARLMERRAAWGWCVEATRFVALIEGTLS